MALAKPLSPSYVFNYCLQFVKALLALEGRGILYFSGAAVGRDGSENCETQPSIQPVFVESLLCALGWDGGKIYRSAFRFTLELGSSVHPLTCLCCFGEDSTYWVSIRSSFTQRYLWHLPYRTVVRVKSDINWNGLLHNMRFINTTHTSVPRTTAAWWVHSAASWEERSSEGICKCECL